MLTRELELQEAEGWGLGRVLFMAIHNGTADILRGDGLMSELGLVGTQMADSTSK